MHVRYIYACLDQKNSVIENTNYICIGRGVDICWVMTSAS